ncbi:expE8 [Asticcacaulis biprosthecium C19]|uniref:ExpE8 n=1 Tax=Asticcacaulis biprosthecium C19 TaxID=715226 RepID=F4QJD9_9CAUL|nr:hypothetical protein [Asticcacaulis biprosthecium]EGF93122.1 expE8 [Asticcacaulis biprosthecium C19]
MIIYDDSEVQVLKYDGKSDFALVTFGSLNSLADGVNFFGKIVGQKANMTVIGFMAKRPNWYPDAQMASAIRSIEPDLSKFAHRVTYGSSMGGYGALKYSRMLNADAALALCPQWSIDPSLVGEFDQRYVDHFTPGRTGTPIEGQDLCAEAFVFADPRYGPDHQHAVRMKGATYITMPFVQHHVAGVLAGTNSCIALVTAALARDPNQIKSLSTALRRQSPRRIVEIIKASVKTHPQWAQRIFDNQMSKLEGKPGMVEEASRHLKKIKA